MKRKSKNRRFSFFKINDPRTTTLLDVENQLVEKIFEKYHSGHLHATVANW